MSVSKKMLTLLGEAAPVTMEKVRADFIEAAELTLSIHAKQKAAAQTALKSIEALVRNMEAMSGVLLVKNADSANSVNADFRRLEELAMALSDYHEDTAIPEDSELFALLDAYRVNTVFKDLTAQSKDVLESLKKLEDMEYALKSMAGEHGVEKDVVGLKADLEKAKKLK